MENTIIDSNERKSAVIDKTAMLTPKEQKALGSIVTWDIMRLKPNPLNPRGEVQPDDPTISELAASITSHGLLQPITATPTGLIVAGHRRYYACIVAGLQMVSVIVRELSEREQLEVMLIENVQRSDLNPLQIAKGYKALNDRGMTIADIAKKVGWAKASVSKHLAILELPEEVQRMTTLDTFALGYIPHLLELKTPEDQLKFARDATAGGWFINELACAVARTKPSRFRPSDAEQDEPYTYQSITIVLPDVVLEYLRDWAQRDKRDLVSHVARQVILQVEFDVQFRGEMPDEGDSFSEKDWEEWDEKLRPYSVVNEPNKKLQQ